MGVVKEGRDRGRDGLREGGTFRSEFNVALVCVSRPPLRCIERGRHVARLRDTGTLGDKRHRDQRQPDTGRHRGGHSGMQVEVLPNVWKGGRTKDWLACRRTNTGT